VEPDSTSYRPPPDQDGIVAALRLGDEQVFAALVDEYGPTMLRVARMYVSSLAVAEEVVQEAWLGVIGGIGRFEGRSSLKTWIFRIVTNIAKTRGAREGRSIPFSSVIGADGEAGKASVEPDRFLGAGRFAGHWTSAPSRWSERPEELLVGGETIGVVEAAIAALPEVQRTVITLRDVEGWSSEEVRNALDLSETNQRVILHRARAKVRQALETYLDGEPT
jgi:RNA polymerase sigma-70 factor (ECF subfamily)